MDRTQPTLTTERSCTGCRHREEGMVFTLCKHPASQYSIAGKMDFHTVGHMRDERRGPCGPTGNHFAA